MTGEKVPRGKRSTAPISKEAPDPITTSESVNKEIGESGIVASMLTRSSDELNLPTQTQQPTASTGIPTISSQTSIENQGNTQSMQRTNVPQTQTPKGSSNATSSNPAGKAMKITDNNVTSGNPTSNNYVSLLTSTPIQGSLGT